MEKRLEGTAVREAGKKQAKAKDKGMPFRVGVVVRRNLFHSFSDPDKYRSQESDIEDMENEISDARKKQRMR